MATAISAAESQNGIETNFYQYNTLPGPRWIRVLRRQLPEDGDGIELRCAIDTINLDDVDRVEYVCLSYTWEAAKYNFPAEDGTSTNPPQRYLFCDGKQMQIGENLYQALQHILIDDSLLWADAISINQADLTERSAQVSIMGDIYAAADLVLVWLGLEDEDAKVAIPLITEIAECLRKLPSKDRLLTLASTLPFNDEDVWKGIGRPPLSIEQWTHISRLFTRPWFERVWVVQEAVLGSSVGAVCGDMRLSLSHMCEVAELVVLPGWSGRIRNATKVTGAAYTGAFELGVSVNHINKGLEYPKQRELHSRVFGAETDAQHLASFCAWIWTSNRQRAASDPRDKIYAPLAIASRLKRDINIPWISPDYGGKDVKDVYTEAANFLLSETNSLSLLSYVEDKKYRKQMVMPSWVPDWSVMETPISINRYFGQFDCSKGLDYLNNGYDLDSTLLPLTGIKVDSIHITLPNSPTSFLNIFGCAQLLAFVNPTNYINQTRLEVLIKTMICDTFQDERKPLYEPPVPWQEVLDSFSAGVLFNLASLIPYDSDIVQNALHLWISNPMLMSLLSSPPLKLFGEQIVEYCVQFRKIYGADPTAEASPEWKKHFYQPTLLFEALSNTKMRHRQLTVTSQKRLLGLVPQSAKSGDQIWIFRGAKVPYIVREVTESSGDPDSGLYEFVGEAYLHEYMHGEAVATLKDNFEEQTIVLR